MKLATAVTTLSLLTFASSAPTASPALGDGTVNVARGDTKDAAFELVDDTSHFSVGRRAVPIEHMNDPAVGKAVGNDKAVDDDDDYARKLWAHADGRHREIPRRLSQHTAVQ